MFRLVNSGRDLSPIPRQLPATLCPPYDTASLAVHSATSKRDRPKPEGADIPGLKSRRATAVPLMNTYLPNTRELKFRPLSRA
jgi:hypothetical protein